MEDKKINLEGLIPAIVIPLKEDFSIDQDILRKYIRKIIKNGIKALAINTDAGEAHYLLPEEKKNILSIAVEEIKGKLPIICGLSGINTKETVEFAKELRDLGADCFLVFPHPSFKGAKGKDRVIINYHEAIAKVGVPLIIFQLQPDLGGTEYPQETLKILVEINEVIAIKEASFNCLKFKETVWFLNSLKKKITILTGNDNFIPESFILGANGALLGFGAIFTELQVKMIEELKKKNYTEAFALYQKIEPICKLCFSQPIRDYRARIKEVMVVKGIFKNSLVRPPLLSISAEEKYRIQKICNLK